MTSMMSLWRVQKDRPPSFIGSVHKGTPPFNHKSLITNHKSRADSLRRVWNQRELAGTHDRRPQLPLVHRAGPRDPARKDLRPLGHERHQQLRVLVVDVIDLVRAELADLAPAEHRTALAVLPLLTP